jgi:hypothetical protein
MTTNKTVFNFSLPYRPSIEVPALEFNDVRYGTGAVDNICSILKQNNFIVLQLRLSQLTMIDIKSYLKSMDNQSSTVILFDEFNRALPEVQKFAKEKFLLYPRIYISYVDIIII